MCIYNKIQKDFPHSGAKNHLITNPRLYVIRRFRAYSEHNSIPPDSILNPTNPVNIFTLTS